MIAPPNITNCQAKYLTMQHQCSLATLFYPASIHIAIGHQKPIPPLDKFSIQVVYSSHSDNRTRSVSYSNFHRFGLATLTGLLFFAALRSRSF